MKVYFAARYERGSDLRAYADELRKMGVQVASSWIHGGQEWSLVNPEDRTIHGAEEAYRDIDEIQASDLVVNFTEDPATAWVRGGRHWECGYAYALGIDQLVVGPHEVVFHCVGAIAQVDTWEEAKAYIAQYKEDFKL